MNIFLGKPSLTTQKAIKSQHEHKYGKPLTFTAEEAGATIRMKSSSMLTYIAPEVKLETSIDDGKTWQPFIVDETTITLANVGDYVLFRAQKNANNNMFSSSAGLYGYNYFDINNGKVAASGSIQYLCNQLGKTTEAPMFAQLFKNCKSLTKAPELRSKVLRNGSYFRMFYECANLTDGPAIFATETATNCFYEMFYTCEKLVNMPKFVLNSLSEMCCYRMFYECSSLIESPAIFDCQNAAKQCCAHMFSYCSSLTKAPELPAKVLAIECYIGMFSKCTSLTQAPELPAKALADQCYDSMFNDCIALTDGPTQLLAKILKNMCYQHMFYGCKSLDHTPIIAEDIVLNNKSELYGMFRNVKSPLTFTDMTFDRVSDLILNQDILGSYWLNEDHDPITDPITIICSDKTFTATYNNKTWVFADV